MSNALEISNLRKSYQGTEAVQGISFNVKKGDFFGFLGPNGAGKTTTINMIVGLANITDGNILVFGKDVVKDYQQTRKMIGLAAQEPSFDPFFPLHRVLEFQAGYFGLGWKEAKQKAEELLKRFGLWEHRKKTPRQISGGMKRRLLIAKALVHKPELLILDEPTAGVDVELRRDLWNFLKELNNEGMTILLTTHYIEEAEELCNKIGIIHHGAMKAIEDKNILMEKLAEKVVELKIEGSNNSVAEKLKEFPNIQITGNTISFPTENVRSHLYKITSLLNEQDVKIIDVSVREYDLEDIFLQLTDDDYAS